MRPAEADGVRAEELARTIERIRETNHRRFSSSDGRTNLRVLDFTFEVRWIYLLELIQNAVDAGARRVSVEHGADWLTLQHDGAERLTEANVIGLSGLFQSTKGVGTVGFMGIGFKSVFRRFQRVQVSGFGWRFRFDVEIRTGEEFGDRQPDLLGTVLPRWDDGIAPPDDGFTTRFELGQLQDASVAPAEDVSHALPASDRTVLALLAHRGLQELRIGDTRWKLECNGEEDVPLAVAKTDSAEERWRLFPVQYQPSREAIARLLERRRIRPSDSERAKVYEEAARPRTVVGVMPVDEQDVPAPPRTGKAYALLPTASAIPLRLHVNADWLVTISRRGLPELEDNQWQNEIVDRVADVVAAYLRWLGSRHRDPDALRAGFGALRVPAEADEGPIVRRIESDEWKRRLRTILDDYEVLPGFEGGQLRLRKPTDTALVPPPLERLADDPGARSDVLFGGPAVSGEVMSRGGADFIRWLGLVPLVTPARLEDRWPEGLRQWWNSFDDETDRRNLLFALWAAFSQLPSESGWERLPVVPTRANTWASPGKIRFPNEPMPGADDPHVESFIEPHLPPAAERPVTGLVEALRAAAGPVRRAAREWFEELAAPVALVDVARAAVAAELEREAPRLEMIIRLTQWAMPRNRADLVTHVVVQAGGGRRAVAVQHALLAEPYVEHGVARRRIWPSSGAVVADYVEEDPSGADAHEWRVFFERLDILGPVRLSPLADHASRYQPQLVADFLGVQLDDIGESNNSGYQLIDYNFNPPLEGIDAHAVAGWLEEGYAALKGKERRRAAYQYRTLNRLSGNRPAAWVDVLNTLDWVPCSDSLLRRPGDVLRAPDPARDEAPVAELSEGLIDRLLEAGIGFGSRVPEAPILRRLQRRAADLTPEELAATLVDAFAHVDAVPEDRPHLDFVLREISYPNGRGGAVPFERLIRTEGGGARSGFGGWLASLNAMPDELRSVLLDPRISVPIPDRTTGRQALAYAQHVWQRAANGEAGLAQEVGDRLPLAYAYILEDLADDEALEQEWKNARESALVFTNRRRWILARGPDAPAFGDVEDSLMRRFLPADLEVATGGHLGEAPADQAKVAAAIGLPKLSTVVSIEPKFGREVDRPDWERRFGDLLRVLNAARRMAEGQATRVVLRATDDLAVEVDGDRKPVASFLEGNALHVAGSPRDFALDAVNHLVDIYGLSQQAKIAAMLAMLMGALDEGEVFAAGLQRFGSEFATDFDLGQLATMREMHRSTPPGKVQQPAGPREGDEADDHEEKLKRAAEKLLDRSSGEEPETADDNKDGRSRGPSHSPPAPRHKGPSPEQRDRGGRGELEMLRRLSQDGGYLGLTLLRDRRKDGCGYDFLSRSVDTATEVEVELKTYQQGGGVHLTLRELERARRSGEHYILIGLVDDGGHPSGWEARRLDAPYAQLARLAEARIDVHFVLPAAAIFTADDD